MHHALRWSNDEPLSYDTRGIITMPARFRMADLPTRHRQLLRVVCSRALGTRRSVRCYDVSRAIRSNGPFLVC